MNFILAFLTFRLLPIASAASCTLGVALSWYDFNHPPPNSGGDDDDKKCTIEDIQNGDTVGCTSRWIGKRSDLGARSTPECSATELCFQDDQALFCFNYLTGE
jgi:hypothetical protein